MKKKNLAHNHQQQESTSEHYCDRLLSTMATFKHASSDGTTIKPTKSIFLVSQDDIVLTLDYSNQDAVVCTKNRKVVSIWLVFKLQFQDDTNIHLQLSYMKFQKHILTLQRPNINIIDNVV